MSKFVVLTDSTCDLPDELAKQHDIDILCFKIALDGEGYTERRFHAGAVLPNAEERDRPADDGADHPVRIYGAV